MEPKPLAVLTSKLPTNTLTGEILSLHKRILQARAQPKTELTAPDLDKLALRVCAELGIRDLPSTEIIDLCLKSWREKFSVYLNMQELLLAFEMNVNGDLPQKVEHYQCFSRDYFCKVLNTYLEAKQTALQKAKPDENEQEQRCAPADYDQQLVQALLTDRQLLAEGKPIATNYTVADRLNKLAALFGLQADETAISAYRIRAQGELVRAITLQKQQARAANKFGLEVELTNQLARLKAGKLLTEKDERLIQAEVNKLLYCEELMKREKMEIKRHILSSTI